MNDTIQAIKDIFATALALGWQPWPSILAILMVLVLRSGFEPDVLQINNEKERSRHGWIKLAIFFGVFIGSGIMHIGLAKPATAYDWCLAVGFSLGHTMVGHVIASSAAVRRLIKSSIGMNTAEQPK